MELDFDAARWTMDDKGTWLCLHVAAPRKAREFCAAVKAGTTYLARLGQKRKRRSLDANAYFWVLAGKLAAKLRVSPEEVYRQYIKDVAGNYVIQPVCEDLLGRWNKIWCDGHLGRMTDDLGECRRTPGYHNIRCYLGSSDYDTVQMSRLIDLIAEDCKLQDIETKTPAELDELKARWADAPADKGR